MWKLERLLRSKTWVLHLSCILHKKKRNPQSNLYLFFHDKITGLLSGPELKQFDDDAMVTFAAIASPMSSYAYDIAEWVFVWLIYTRDFTFYRRQWWQFHRGPLDAFISHAPGQAQWHLCHMYLITLLAERCRAVRYGWLLVLRF